MICVFTLLLRIRYNELLNTMYEGIESITFLNSSAFFDEYCEFIFIHWHFIYIDA